MISSLYSQQVNQSNQHIRFNSALKAPKKYFNNTTVNISPIQWSSITFVTKSPAHLKSPKP